MNTFALRLLFVQVIAAIGFAMIVLAALVFLPRWAIAVAGLLIVSGHNLLDPLTVQDFGSYGGPGTSCTRAA